MASKDQKTGDTLVIETSFENCQKIRTALVDKFSHLWFYLYPKGKFQGSIMMANEFGGKVEKKIAEEVVKFAKEMLKK